MCPYISVVTPVYHAEHSIPELVRRLNFVISKLNSHFEIILVDDGSTDRSWKEIEKQCSAFPHVKGIKLSRNFGQHVAITAGLNHAHGEWVVVMDCDLQDSPEEIPNLLHRALEMNCEIVLAERQNRQDVFSKRILSKVFYRVLSFLTGTQYNNSVANFGIYHRSVIRAVLKMPERSRFFPAMINWVGFSRTTLPVSHQRRLSGKTSYNFNKRLALATDIILAYSDKPLRLVIMLGFLMSIFSFLLGIVTLIQYYQGVIYMRGYTSLLIAMCFFSGIIVSVLGIIGLYIGKIFDGTKNRPMFLISKIINEEQISS